MSGGQEAALTSGMEMVSYEVEGRQSTGRETFTGEKRTRVGWSGHTLEGRSGFIWTEVVPGFCSEWEDCKLGSYTLG